MKQHTGLFQLFHHSIEFLGHIGQFLHCRRCLNHTVSGFADHLIDFLYGSVDFLGCRALFFRRRGNPH